MRRSSAAFALAIQCVATLGFPLAETWHEHRSSEHAQWHADNDRCERTPAPFECALLRASRAPAAVAAGGDHARLADLGVLAEPDGATLQPAGRAHAAARARAPPA